MYNWITHDQQFICVWLFIHNKKAFTPIVTATKKHSTFQLLQSEVTMSSFISSLATATYVTINNNRYCLCLIDCQMDLALHVHENQWYALQDWFGNNSDNIKERCFGYHLKLVYMFRKSNIWLLNMLLDM